MNIILCAMVLFSIQGCGGSKKKEPAIGLPADYQRLVNKYNEKLALASTQVDPLNGWLEQSECDAMLWAGKFACAGGSPNLAAAEYSNEPGKFNRKPLPYCGAEFGNSQTTWSRDMGMGLISGAWCSKNLAVIERHADYGTKKNWAMGSPLADGRTVYTPSIIGILYQTIFALGGKDSQARVWPSVYSSGLDDYQAHLQMLDIWLRGDISGKPTDFALDISQTMFDRVKEHSDREPTCAFYQYLRGIYEGNLDKTTSLLLESDNPRCSYVRGGISVPDIEWLFTAKLVTSKFDVVVVP